MYWKTSTAAAWDSATWSSVSGGPYTEAWVSGSSVIFEDNLGTALTIKGPAATTNFSSITANENGDFYVWGAVNGSTVRFAVDTGASDIVLSPADAKRAGFNVAGLTYGGQFETANGVGLGAFVTLDTLNIGPIAFDAIPASVNRTAMRTSLLGMAFLKRLKSFEFSKQKLVLRY